MNCIDLYNTHTFLFAIQFSPECDSIDLFESRTCGSSEPKTNKNRTKSILKTMMILFWFQFPYKHCDMFKQINYSQRIVLRTYLNLIISFIFFAIFPIFLQHIHLLKRGLFANFSYKSLSYKHIENNNNDFSRFFLDFCA